MISHQEAIRMFKELFYRIKYLREIAFHCRGVGMNGHEKWGRNIMLGSQGDGTR